MDTLPPGAVKEIAMKLSEFWALMEHEFGAGTPRCWPGIWCWDP